MLSVNTAAASMNFSADEPQLAWNGLDTPGESFSWAAGGTRTLDTMFEKVAMSSVFQPVRTDEELYVARIISAAFTKFDPERAAVNCPSLP